MDDRLRCPKCRRMMAANGFEQDELAAMVAQRTAELELELAERIRVERKTIEQLEELRRWHDATLGREERILELKREINELALRIGEPVRYHSATNAG